MAKASKKDGGKTPDKSTRKKRGGRTPMPKSQAVTTKDGAGVAYIMHPKKKALLEALESTLGVVTPACRKVGITRRTYYDYIADDPVFKAAVEDLKNVALDFVETNFFQRVADQSDACMIFYLKTQGKARGYIERTEITGSNGAPIAIQVVTPDAEMQKGIDSI